MHLIKLIIRNALRHRLRTGLTMLGLVVAILSVITSYSIHYTKLYDLEFADIGYVLVSGETAIVGPGSDLLKNPDVGRLFLGG